MEASSFEASWACDGNEYQATKIAVVIRTAAKLAVKRRIVTDRIDIAVKCLSEGLGEPIKETLRES